MLYNKSNNLLSNIIFFDKNRSLLKVANRPKGITRIAPHVFLEDMGRIHRSNITEVFFSMDQTICTDCEYIT